MDFRASEGGLIACKPIESRKHKKRNHEKES